MEIFHVGEAKVKDYREQKEEQEYHATLPNWSLPRAAHAPVSLTRRSCCDPYLARRLQSKRNF